MAYYEKRTKIAILQDRANQYNKDFDYLEDQGHDLYDIPKILKQKENDSKQKTQVTQPFDEYKNVIEVGATFQQGYLGAHKVLSNTKDMFQLAEKNQQTLKHKIKNNDLQDLKDQIKQKRDQEKLLQGEIRKDHIAQQFAALQQGKPVQSTFGESFAYTNQMQDLVKNQDIDYHLKKNDLNTYSEAYVVHKSTLRK